MRRALAILSASLVLGGCAETESAPGIRSETFPERIVLIVVDMLRRDHVGIYGGDVATPHIDALAGRGQAFANAVSSYGQTTMSMGALFTGKTPSIETGDPKQVLRWVGRNWCGLARFADDDESACVPANLPTLANELRRSGYTTLGVCSNLLLYRPAGFARGFDAWIEPGARTAEDPENFEALPRQSRGAFGGTSADAVNRAVRVVLENRADDRFFLYVHYMDAHDFKEYGISYAAGVRRVDSGVGALLAMLQTEGLLEGALIVLTSDHGERFLEEHPVRGLGQHYGNPSFDSLLKVPLVVAPPLAQDVHRLIRGEDLMGLILAQAVGRPATVEAERNDDLFYSEWAWQTLRTERWKILVERSTGRAVLFDLVADPDETQNLADRHPEVVDEFRSRIAALTLSLSTTPRVDESLSQQDRRRLRALGYLEGVEAAESHAAESE